LVYEVCWDGLSIIKWQGRRPFFDINVSPSFTLRMFQMRSIKKAKKTIRVNQLRHGYRVFSGVGKHIDIILGSKSRIND
jgi:hypothetical protein